MFLLAFLVILVMGFLHEIFYITIITHILGNLSEIFEKFYGSFVEILRIIQNIFELRI